MISNRTRWTAYAWAIAAVLACTLAGLAMRLRFDLVNIAMVYLVPIALMALLFSRGPTVLASILSVTAFDFCFVPPRGAFSIDDLQYLFTFAIMLGIGLMISRLKESVQRQASAKEKLAFEAETERMRSTLLASISHDLRTPLAVMSGASSTLAERGQQMTASERKALAESIFAQTREMSEHVSKLLQMTRLENGTLQVERDWAALSEIIGAVLRRLQERMSRHRLIVEVPDELPLIRVDAALVEQALGNLLENAAKHTPIGTVVRLRAQARNSELIVSVEDFGDGVRDGDHERVFAMFHRGVVEGSAGGMGLGLSICRAIVRLHGGRAWGERLSGGGTAFRFSLPVEKPPHVPPEASTA